MTPFALYLLAAISIAYPIDYYIKREYGERRLSITLFLSSIWFLIPFGVFALLIRDLKESIDNVNKEESGEIK